MSTADVMIVGAGPTGLTLAIDLARRGVDAVLVEAETELPRQSRGKGLQPRSLEVFDDLGVVDTLLEQGEWRQDITLYADQRRLARLPAGLAEPRPDLPYPNILMIPQWRITAVLEERLGELGGKIRFGTRLAGFTAGSDGVRAELVTADGGHEELEVRYLVGCDGGRSAVRRTLGIEFAGVSREHQRYLLGDVTVPGWDPEGSGVVRSHAWMGRDGSFLGLAGLPGTGQWQIGASIGPDDDLEPSLDVLQRLWDERTGHTDVRLTDPTWLSNFKVNVRMVDEYRHGRVLLAGDAAHVHPPTGGQGMNTGIQDAYNLGWKLVACLRGADDALLDSYQAERLPIARGVLEKSTDILDVVTSRNPLVAFAVRRILLPLLRRPAVNRALTSRVSQIDVGYRSGPLTEDGVTGGRVRAGDRAPDALIDAVSNESVRLHDVLRGPHWTLLLVGDSAARHLDITALPDGVTVAVIAGSARPGVRVLQDRDRTFHRAYRAASGTALLIRPDGYVAWRAEAPDHRAVLAHLPSGE
ncbi:FAD-dependent monooxygenase [Kribbella sp. DT2]|uniref:FAD-dependent monooxygenase n=1 Tax=Kribbella sp. DT2 TaxID=3393427 RepID=UPI003CF73825